MNKKVYCRNCLHSVKNLNGDVKTCIKLLPPERHKYTGALLKEREFVELRSNANGNCPYHETYLQTIFSIFRRRKK